MAVSRSPLTSRVRLSAAGVVSFDDVGLERNLTSWSELPALLDELGSARQPTFAQLQTGDSPRVNAEGTDPAGAFRAARMTQNEAFFRDVNEQINALNSLGAQSETFGVVCECGRERCGKVIYVHRSLYETVRGQSDRFIVASAHVLPEIEKVVEECEGFVVVDKHDGIPEKIAAITDPRA